jgi:tetratricopeptide (TPR) repeat protein
MRFGKNNIKKFFGQMNLCLLLFIFLSCVVAGSCQTDDQRYETQLKNCIEKGRSDTEDGIRCLEVLRKSDPDRGSTYLMLARNYRESGRLSEAEENINIFVNSYKNDASGYGVKCEILRDKKDLKEALLACDKAMSIQPDEVSYKRTIASVYEAQGDFERAENWYLMSLKTNPDDPNTLIALGKMYEKNGNLDKAIETYEKLLKQDDFEFKEKLREGIERLKNKKKTQTEEKNKADQKPN